MIDVFWNAEASAAFLQQQIDSRRLLDFVTHSHLQGEKEKVEACQEDAALRSKGTRGPWCEFRVFISTSFNYP